MSVKVKRKKRRGLGIITVFLICILCVVAYYSMNLIEKQGNSEKRIESLNNKIYEEEQKTNDLEQRKAYTQTRKYIEEVARKYLGLVYPDEVVIQPEK